MLQIYVDSTLSSDSETSQKASVRDKDAPIVKPASLQLAEKVLNADGQRQCYDQLATEMEQDNALIDMECSKPSSLLQSTL
jgi:hypothetical protein